MPSLRVLKNPREIQPIHSNKGNYNIFQGQISKIRNSVENRKPKHIADNK